jgi:hypothetical protein
MHQALTAIWPVLSCLLATGASCKAADCGWNSVQDFSDPDYADTYSSLQYLLCNFGDKQSVCTGTTCSISADIDEQYTLNLTRTASSTPDFSNCTSEVVSVSLLWGMS